MEETNDALKSRSTASAADHLANERTFLAWIRTSIALMGFGFVVVKFSLFVKQLSLMLTDKAVVPVKGFSAYIGISLVVIGALTAVIGFVRYWQIRKQILNRNFAPSFNLLLLLTIAVIAVSGMLIWYLLPNL
jgi:putative membrane protein